jgi:BppU N-terminal domain
VSGCPPKTLCCGPFLAGEHPDPITYTFLDAAGAPIDLQGYQVRFCWAERWTGPVGDANAQTIDAPGGTVSYDWGHSDLAAPGQYTALFWAEKGNQRRYASLPIRFDVVAAACGAAA